MKFEIKQVPGTKSAPYHYQLYVDDVLVYTRKTCRLYNAGAVSCDQFGSGDRYSERWTIIAMRADATKFEKWMYDCAATTIVPVGIAINAQRK